MTFLDMTETQRARLSEVFDLVKPEGNWKMPIHARVPKTAATEREVSDAVIFYCGGVPFVVEDGEHWVVTGAGYYEWVGA